MTHHRTLPLLALAATLGFGAMGCTIAATPPNLSVAPSVSTTTHVVHYSAPPRVYYEGRWLYYRTDGYYYRSGPTWVVARSVPTHVHAYHRPARPVHVVSHPGPSHYHYSRPAPQGRPTHVSSPGPTHVRRTVTNRRTYYRR